MVIKGSSTWAILYCFLRHINKEMVLKWNIRGSNWWFNMRCQHYRWLLKSLHPSNSSCPCWLLYLLIFFGLIVWKAEKQRKERDFLFLGSLPKSLQQVGLCQLEQGTRNTQSGFLTQVIETQLLGPSPAASHVVNYQENRQQEQNQYFNIWVVSIPWQLNYYTTQHLV